MVIVFAGALAPAAYKPPRWLNYDYSVNSKTIIWNNLRYYS